jgi:hypothetical protein
MGRNAASDRPRSLRIESERFELKCPLSPARRAAFDSGATQAGARAMLPRRCFKRRPATSGGAAGRVRTSGAAGLRLRALNLSPDRAVSRPLEAVHKDAACLGNAPPDHIDIVSVATCSPQIEVSPSKSEFYRTWHQDFRDSFLRAAKDDALARHHFAVFVLSNFRMLSEKSPGGLSGAFIPVRPEDIRPEDKPIEFLNISQWGRLKAQDGDSNRWSTPNDDAAQWSGLGYIASLNPFSDGAKGVARMFGFTFPQLPRHMHRWQSKLGLVKYAVKITEPDSSPLTFVSG